MAELLAVFLGFWVFFPTIAMFLLMFAWVAYEVPIGATVTLIATAAVLQFKGNIQIVESVIAHPFWTIAFVLGYFLIGVLWSIAKWRLFCDDLGEAYREAKEEFYRSDWTPEGRASNAPKTKDEEWRRICGYKFPHFADGMFSARMYKAKILVWMTYWPWSFLWTFLNDLVKRVFNSIYLRIQRIYQAIANHAFQDILQDFPGDRDSRE